MDDSIREMMVAIVERLRAYLDGNEGALQELSEVLDSRHFDAELMAKAFEVVLRSLDPSPREEFPVGPTKEAQRVAAPDASDQAVLPSTPAISYLFGLLESGKVSSDQFEEILARARELGPSLTTEGQAKDLATEILIRWFDDENGVAHDPSSPLVH